MGSNTLSIKTLEEVPRTFIRGQTLEFVMDLPCDVPSDYFQDATVSSELRQLQNAGENGFIGTLTVTWEPFTQHTKLRFLFETTDEWPLGPAEFDVVFTRGTKKYRSLPVQILIQDGVTA